MDQEILRRNILSNFSEWEVENNFFSQELRISWYSKFLHNFVYDKIKIKIKLNRAFI